MNGVNILNAFIKFKESFGKKRISSKISFIAGARYAETALYELYGYNIEVRDIKTDTLVNSWFIKENPPKEGPIDNPVGFYIKAVKLYNKRFEQ